MATKVKPTRRELVHNALKAARRGKLTVNGQAVKTPAGWVPGHLLTHPEIGGTEGLRRLRELRTDGLAIEMKAIGNGSAAYQYRLAK
jgi:hypothetical protein